MRSLRAVLAIVSLAAAMAAGAAAPMSKAPQPGYFRFMVGDFQVVAISDGTAELPMDKLLLGTTAEKVDQVAAKAFLKMPEEGSFSGFLVNTGTKVVLIDTGAGTLFAPTLGKFMANLKAAGYAPEQVDEIYITHFHPDHVGGLSTEGKANFPNAIVRADKREADYWLSKENLEKADKGSKGGFLGAQSMLEPYVKAGKFKTFEGDTDLMPGIKAVSTYGHTKGHTSYVAESKGQKIVFLGDLIHFAPVQFPDPSIAIKFDTDPKEAVAERRKIFSEAAKTGEWVAGPHLPFPAIGHLVASGKGYAFLPINYTTR